MRNILLVIIVMISVVSCVKTKQRLFHHKNWKNIQGTWDIEDAWEDGTSIVDSIKNSYCKLYSVSKIEYQSDRERDGLLHLYDDFNRDFGAISIESENYKRIKVNNFNFNITVSKYYIPCKNQFYIGDTSVFWNIEELTNSDFIISSSIRNKSYKIKYKKI